MNNKAAFFDRDGVINVEKNYVYKIEDFEFIEGVTEVLRKFQDLGYLLFIITNQAGIGRGYYTEQDFYNLTDWMLNELQGQGIHIMKVYHSPYHPEHGIGSYLKDSFCRKPNPGMILKAQEDYALDLSTCYLIGDKESDIEAGQRAGIHRTILFDQEMKPDSWSTKATDQVSQMKEIINLIG